MVLFVSALAIRSIGMPAGEECANYEHAIRWHCATENLWYLSHAVAEGAYTLATGWGGDGGPVLVIFEHDADGTPHLISEFPIDSYHRNLTNQGRRAVVRSGAGQLASIDWSDPLAPTLEPFVDAPPFAHDYSQGEGWLAVGGGEAGVWLYASPPDGPPSHLATVPTVGEAADAVVLDGVLYVAEGSWVRAYDIADPAHPDLVQEWPSQDGDGDPLETLVIESDGTWLAILANQVAGGYTSTIVLDPADDLRTVGEVTHHSWMLRVVDGYLCTRRADPLYGASVYAISADGLEEVFYTWREANDIAIGDGFMTVVSSNHDLDFYEMRGETEIPPRVSWAMVDDVGADVRSYTADILVAQRNVAYEGTETWLWDIHEPRQPVLIQHWPPGTWGTLEILRHGDGWANIFARSGSGYGGEWLCADVTTQPPSVYVQTLIQDRHGDRGFGYDSQDQAVFYGDISDPRNPVALATLDGYVGDLLAIDATRAIGTTSDDELVCVDFSDLASPTVWSTGLIMQDIRWLGRQDDLVFVRNRGAGVARHVAAIDVSDPTDLRLFWAWDADDGEYLAGQGEYAAFGRVGMITIFEISEPGPPTMAGEVAIDWEFSESGVWKDGILYAASGAVVDVRQPDQPRLLGKRLEHLLPLYYWRKTFENGGLIIGADGGYPLQCDVVAGIEDDHADQPDHPGADHGLLATPNPFNPMTTIQFDLATAGAIDLGIYDLRGRRRAVLRHGHLAAGQHHVRWTGRDDDGRELPSGTYIIRLAHGSGTVGIKVSLVR